ncbi:hypothetical protein DIRU0_E17590 [Diutina rugosa]
MPTINHKISLSDASDTFATSFVTIDSRQVCGSSVSTPVCGCIH